ncbi:MAG: tetratricopeptide repeat protein [bacterium]|nr:tetratricopeptide repeat protein [bacterium]
MPVSYLVSIKNAKSKNQFTITWLNVHSNSKNSFQSPAPDLAFDNSSYSLATGAKLFDFLNGKKQLFNKALDEALTSPDPLTINLSTTSSCRDWPFELIAADNTFLCPANLHLIRKVTPKGKAPPINTQTHLLKILFSAPSPQNIRPVLDFEKEEVTAFKATEHLAVDLEIETSGSLKGIGDRVAAANYDVIHISGLTGIEEGVYGLILESDTGYRRFTEPGSLWFNALSKNPPSLLFLSGHPGPGAVGQEESTVFARKLAKEFLIPAVLAWSAPIDEKQAIVASEALFRALSRGLSITGAVALTRLELFNRFPNHPAPAWPLLRLFTGGQILNPPVQPAQSLLPEPRSSSLSYLNNSRVTVLADGFVGRRRALQRCLRVFSLDKKKVGVFIYGPAGVGKSCLAGKLCRLFPKHLPIVLHGSLTPISLKNAFLRAFTECDDEKALDLLAEKMALPDILKSLCSSSLKVKNFLLVLDDFQQNFEVPESGGAAVLIPEAAELLGALLAFLPLSEKMSQLIITCRYEMPSAVNVFQERLKPVSLSNFSWADQLISFRQLKHLFVYPDRSMALFLLKSSHGHPLLMEWLNILVGELTEDEVAALENAVSEKPFLFILDFVIDKLLNLGGELMKPFLQVCSIYRRPVLEKGLICQATAVGIKEPELRKLIDFCLALNLLVQAKERNSFLVRPGLRDVLLNGMGEVKVELCHRTAVTYFSMVYSLLDKEKGYDAEFAEEWLYHTLGCEKEEEASEVGRGLVNFYRENQAYREALRVGQCVLAAKKLPLSNEADAFLLNEVGFAWFALGEKLRGIECYERAITILKAVYGEVHREIATALNNLGSAWEALGETSRGIEYYEQALDIDRALFGNEHPSVSRELNNLGSAWDSLGEKQWAIEHFEQALTIDRVLFGNKHPNVARELNFLGAAYKTIGRPRKAIEFYNEALEVIRALFGLKHPKVAIQLNNLGGAHSALGEIRQAIEYFEPAFIIWKDHYGEMHPNVASSLNNIGYAWDALGEKQRAIEYFEQALKIVLALFGYEHATVATSFNNLGSVYFNMGQKEQARDYFQQAFSIFNKLLGPNHANTKVVAKWLEDCR